MTGRFSTSSSSSALSRLKASWVSQVTWVSLTVTNSSSYSRSGDTCRACKFRPRAGARNVKNTARHGAVPIGDGSTGELGHVPVMDYLSDSADREKKASPRWPRAGGQVRRHLVGAAENVRVHRLPA